MTTVYLIRHAEAEGNLYRIAHGQYDGLITDRGYKQLRVLKKRFDNVHIDAVYSSDLFRARTTARAIYEPKGLELHLEPAFREIHMGCWEGRPWQELNTAYEEQMFYFNRQLDKFHVEGSETAQQVLDRYIPALKRVAAENDGKTVAAADMLVPGIGELIGGSQREEDYDKLVTRMDELGLDKSSYDWYLNLRKFGGVEHAGYGLGFERMIMYLTGIQNIRDVLPFPRTAYGF